MHTGHLAGLLVLFPDSWVRLFLFTVRKKFPGKIVLIYCHFHKWNFSGFSSGDSNMRLPRQPKKSRSKKRCKTEGSGTYLDPADYHCYCVACLDDTYFKPSFKDQTYLHYAGFNPSSYRDRQRRSEKTLEEGPRGLVQIGTAITSPRSTTPACVFFRRLQAGNTSEAIPVSSISF